MPDRLVHECDSLKYNSATHGILNLELSYLIDLNLICRMSDLDHGVVKQNYIDAMFYIWNLTMTNCPIDSFISEDIDNHYLDSKLDFPIYNDSIADIIRSKSIACLIDKLDYRDEIFYTDDDMTIVRNTIDMISGFLTPELRYMNTIFSEAGLIFYDYLIIFYTSTAS